METDLQSLNSEKYKLENELSICREQRNKLEEQIIELKKEESNLKLQITDKTKITTEQNAKIKEMEVEKHSLKEQIAMYEQELIQAVEERRKYEYETKELSKEIDDLRKSPCTVPEHSNFSKLNKQNEILRQVIKNMKKERLENNPEFDSKLKSIEDMVSLLKSNLLFDLKKRMREVD